MMRRALYGIICLLGVLLWAVARPVPAAQTAGSGTGKAAAMTPGNAERRAILEALRVPVRKQLKGRAVVFKVDRLAVRDGWAFMTGIPQQPNGKPIDYRGTPFQEARDAGAFDDGICALLRRDKKTGRWRVIQYVIGATDVPWDGWDRQYKAPSALFRN